jgi:hypothetical protein
VVAGALGGVHGGMDVNGGGLGVGSGVGLEATHSHGLAHDGALACLLGQSPVSELLEAGSRGSTNVGAELFGLSNERFHGCRDWSGVVWDVWVG